MWWWLVPPPAESVGSSYPIGKRTGAGIRTRGESPTGERKIGPGFW